MDLGNVTNSRSKPISKYDNIAKHYDLLFDLITFGRIPKTKKLVLKNINYGEKILEVGCGTGWLSCQCVKKGAKLVALDISDAMLELAKERAKKESIDENIRFMKIDFLNEDLPIIKKKLHMKFDKIIFCFILDIFPEEAMVCKMIEKAMELLENDGQIIIADELIPENPVINKMAAFARSPVFKYLEKTTNMKHHEMHDFISLLKKLGFKDIDIELMPTGYLGVLTVRK